MIQKDLARSIECAIIGGIERLKKGDITIEELIDAIESIKRLMDGYFAVSKGSIFKRLWLHVTFERRMIKEAAEFDKLANILLGS